MSEFIHLAPIIIGVLAFSFFYLAVKKFLPALALAGVAYPIVSEAMSVAYLEQNKVYSMETGIVSGVSGALIPHLIYSAVIMCFALIVMRRVLKILWPKIEGARSGVLSPHGNRRIQQALAVAGALLTVQFFNVLSSPPYALPGSGVSRVQFWSNIRFEVVADFLGVLAIFVPAIAGAAQAYGKVADQRMTSLGAGALVFLYILYFLASGARFNGSLVALIMWLTSYSAIMWSFGQTIRLERMGVPLSIAVCIFFFIGYLDIADRGIATLQGGAWEAFLYRIFALQGDVFYAAFTRVAEGERYPITLLVSPMTSSILAHMPSGLANIYILNETNLMVSISTNSMMVLGYFGALIPVFIFAIILGLSTAIYVYVISTGRFFTLFPASYIILWINGIYNKGSFSIMFEWKFLIFCIFSCFLLLFIDKNLKLSPTNLKEIR